MHHDEKEIQEKRKEIYQKHKEDGNSEAAEEKLKELLSLYTFTELENSMNIIIESISGNNKEKKIDLHAHKKRLFKKYSKLVNVILNAMIEVSYKIPSNVYNLKEALLNFAQVIDIEDEYKTQMASSCFKAKVTHDLDVYQEFYDKGFEEGYAKAQKVLTKEDLEDRWTNTLDLD